MAALFATTLFLSASLLFLVQPMVAKMVLPLLGGTPSVWNTCLVFFQAMLLAGYLYAHVVAQRLTLRRQVLVHLVVLLVAVLALPIGLAKPTLTWLPVEQNPSFWLLGCLLLSVGAPFVAIAANGPLLQKWFSHLSHRSADDPYFLYASSNAGSLLALLGYPLLMEPCLRLQEQSWTWTAGYLVLIVFILCCGMVGLLACHPSTRFSLPDASVGAHDVAKPVLSGRQRGRWVLLAFVPSSLLTGITTYLTTDIASIPLLWVLPLAIYLFTFVLAFARRQFIREHWVVAALPAGALALCYLLLSEATQPVWLIILLHMGVFLVAALACHIRLAAERPAARELTEFYLWISVGGVLGGGFNALVAPVIFTRVTEYPIALLLACGLRPMASLTSAGASVVRWRRWWAPAALGVLALVWLGWVPHAAKVPLQVRMGLMFGLPLLGCYLLVDRPWRFALAVGVVMWAGFQCSGNHGKALWEERNFFGVLRVTQDPIGPFYRLVHGNTVHGRQAKDPEQCCEPLSYYHRSGPAGQIMKIFKASSGSRKVGIVGMGAGSLAAYAAENEAWTFYEINPAVVRLARDTNYFKFIERCASNRVEVMLGDARLRLREAPAEVYGLLVLDAFSSDAIPLHLITREALQLYVAKLAPDGLLAFHISNRYLELENVLGDLAQDAHLVCRAREEMDPGQAEEAAGADASHWVVMARRSEDLGRLNRDSRWQPVRGRAKSEVWTDDFCNLLRVFHWE